MLLSRIRVSEPYFPDAPRLAAIVARHHRAGRTQLVALGLIVAGLLGLGFLV